MVPAIPMNIRDLVELPPRAMRRSFHNREIARIVQAAFHQLKVTRMSPAQRARHDPKCELCNLQVRWKPGAEEKLLRSGHSR